jgi:hypothetical protein
MTNDTDNVSEVVEVPVSCGYTEEEFGPRKYKVLKTGVWMPAEIISATRGVVPTTKNLSLRLGFNMLDADGNQVNHARSSMDFYPPLVNKAALAQGIRHEAPDTLFSAYCLALTLEDNFPRYAHKKGTTGMFETANGDTISGQEMKRIRAEVDTAIQRAAAKYYDNADALVGRRCFVYVEKRKNSKTGAEFIAVTKTRQEPPGDEIAIIDGDVFAVQE